MPNRAPALEIPATLHVVKVKYQDRDYRYPAYFPVPKHRPVSAESYKQYLQLFAAAAVLGVIIGVIYCLGG
jgi:hypothetical protein